MTRILIAGQAVLDLIFDVDAIPDAARKYRATGGRIAGGGCAANAAVAVARLGGRAHLAACVGDDEIGALIMDGLAAEGVETSNIARRTGSRSSYSAVMVDPAGERQIVNLRGDPPGPPDAWRLPRLDAVLADTRWVEGAAAALDLARAAGIPGILDAEPPIDAPLAENASHVVFSRQGLSGFTGLDSIEDGLHAAAARLPGWVAVTDGAAGCFWVARGAIAHAPSFAVEAVDTLGAGDVWHGAFTLRLAEGAARADAIRFAAAAAALKCTRPGGRAGTPDRAEVEKFLKETDR
ncbi:PfkB family carbohydrate kinase [Rhodovulum sp. YNF3179]|uniref:PfkB family carbohydrate kinase n=1 Tax=Rhodovulum sp. YNF3179 TaxID=3425127 RepID=UPI003D335D67